MAITIDGSANTVAGLAVGGLPDGVVDQDMLAAAAVNASKIANTTITAAQIAAATITASQIASDTITASQIAANAVGDSELSATTGKVLKIQWNHHAGQGSTNSSSYEDIRESTAFTPTAADSNLIVLISTSIGNDVTAGTGGNANYRIVSKVDGTTTALGPDPCWNKYGKVAGDGGLQGDYVNFSYVYECGSTDAVEFAVQGIKQDGSSNAHVGGRVGDNYYASGVLFTIIEVAG